MKNRVLVIIVTYNGMKWIDRCFESLKASKEPLDVFIVDNASTDGTVERIREICKDWFKDTDRNGAGWWVVDIVETGKNLGFGKANNIGIKFALENGYEYVYLMNEDAWIFPYTVTNLIEAFERNPEYGVLSPVQMTATLKNQDPRFERKCRKYIPDLSKGTKGLDDVYPVPFVMAAHWMISRKCLDKVGGFSPAFPHYGEDDNFLHRCCWFGFLSGVAINAVAVHDRENRPESKAQRMRLKYVAQVVKISDPNANLAWRLIRQPLELLAISVIRFSWSSFVGVFKLLASYPRLISLRKASRRGHSFLDE